MECIYCKSWIDIPDYIEDRRLEEVKVLVHCPNCQKDFWTDDPFVEENLVLFKSVEKNLSSIVGYINKGDIESLRLWNLLKDVLEYEPSALSLLKKTFSEWQANHYV